MFGSNTLLLLFFLSENLLCGAPVDLYQLFTETTGRGGYEQVCTSKQWREIFRQLPQYSQTHTSASYALKKM